MYAMNDLLRVHYCAEDYNMRFGMVRVDFRTLVHVRQTMVPKHGIIRLVMFRLVSLMVNNKESVFIIWYIVLGMVNGYEFA